MWFGGGGDVGAGESGLKLPVERDKCLVYHRGTPRPTTHYSLGLGRGEKYSSKL